MSAHGDYYHRASEHPTAFVREVLRLFNPARGAAIDLGAGNLRDAKYLLRRGFRRVVAVDNSSKVLEFDAAGVEVVIADIEEYLPGSESFDLALCHNTLYFLSKAGVERVLGNVYTYLNPGGIFAFVTLGPGHSQCLRKFKHPDAPYYSREALMHLCSRFSILGIAEERDSERHYFAVVLKKP